MGKKRLQLDYYNSYYKSHHSTEINPIIDLSLCWNDISLPDSTHSGKVCDYEHTHMALSAMSYIFYISPKRLRKLTFFNFGMLNIESIPSLGICIDSYNSYAIYDSISKTVYVWENTPKGHLPVLLGKHCLETRDTTVSNAKHRRLVEDYAYLLLNLWLEYTQHTPLTYFDQEDWEPYGEEYTQRFRKVYYNKTLLGFTYITLHWLDSFKMRKGVAWKRYYC